MSSLGICHGWSNCKYPLNLELMFVEVIVDRRALLAINVNGSTGLKFTPGQCGAWQIVQGALLQIIVTAVDVILVTRGASS